MNKMIHFIKMIFLAIGLILMMGAAGTYDNPATMDTPAWQVLSVCVLSVICMAPALTEKND